MSLNDHFIGKICPPKTTEKTLNDKSIDRISKAKKAQILKLIYSLLSTMIKAINNSISCLKPLEKMDLTPPESNDDIVYLPVEGTFNNRFFILYENAFLFGLLVLLL